MAKYDNIGRCMQIDKKVLHPVNPANKVPLYNSLPKSCWADDGRRLFTVTEHDIDYALLTFNFDGGECVKYPCFYLF